MLHERPPDVQLLDVHAEECAEFLMAGLEEGEVVALEIHGGAEPHRRERLESERVHQLDHRVHVAVLLHPQPVVGVEGVARVARRTQAGKNGEPTHGHNCERTLAGQPSGSSPCVLSSAITTRSNPNPTHAECAVRPSGR